jgi:hypothetical protein
MDAKRPEENLQATPTLQPEDYYFDGPNMVFTAVYHLKRGYCCRSGCRHCPFSESDPGHSLIVEKTPS